MEELDEIELLLEGDGEVIRCPVFVSPMWLCDLPLPFILPFLFGLALVLCCDDIDSTNLTLLFSTDVGANADFTVQGDEDFECLTATGSPPSS